LETYELKFLKNEFFIEETFAPSKFGIRFSRYGLTDEFFADSEASWSE